MGMPLNHHFNLYMTPGQASGLSELACHTGQSMAALMRQGIDMLLAMRGCMQSGACIKGFLAETTSGTVWLGRGL